MAGNEDGAPHPPPLSGSVGPPATPAAPPSALLIVPATDTVSRCAQLDDDMVKTMQGVMLRYERTIAFGQLPVVFGFLLTTVVGWFRPVPFALPVVFAVLLGGTFLIRPCATWLLARTMAKLGVARPLTLALLRELRWLAFRRPLGALALPDARARVQAREASAPTPPWLEPGRHA